MRPPKEQWKPGLLVAVATLLAACSGTTTESTPAIEVTTTTEEAGPAEVTFPPLPIEDSLSKFEEGELVAVFGWPLEDHATLWGLPTDRGDRVTGGSGNFDRQATDLVASGIASSYEGDVAWEHLAFGGLDERGNPLYAGFVPPDRVGFLGLVDDVTSEAAGLTNERVDDLGLDVAEHFAETEGLEVIPITRREFGGRELTFDLMGGIDDATAGWRIHVEMDDGEPYGVIRVERTLLCWFAVDEAGLCSGGPPE